MSALSVCVSVCVCVCSCVFVRGVAGAGEAGQEAEAAAGRETKKTALEQLIPETSMRGRKRRRAGNGDGDTALSSKDLSAFEAFRSKLAESAARAPPADENGSRKNKNKTSSSAGRERADDDDDDAGRRTENEEDAKTGAAAGAEDDEAELCDLHFIANCQSCRAWGDEEADGGGGGQKDKDDDDDDDADGAWLAHRLSFAADKLGKDLSYRKKAEEELVVIDPREKARTLREERQARLGGEGGGGGGREWDRQATDMARNRKLARASALAGRGAR